MKTVLIISLFYCLFCQFCCGQVSNKDQMIATVKLLMQKLARNDSTGILQLYEKNRIADPDIREKIASECHLFQKIIKKYGNPSTDSLIFSKEYNGANKVSITLMNQIDSVLEIKKSDLVVWFYSDQFLVNQGKFSDFIITTKSISPQKLERIPVLNSLPNQ